MQQSLDKPGFACGHEKFAEKHQLRVLLLSDEKHEVAETYDVWKLKRLYGKEYHGIERSTFLITQKGSWPSMEKSESERPRYAVNEPWKGSHNKNHFNESHPNLVIVANKRG